MVRAALDGSVLPSFQESSGCAVESAFDPTTVLTERLASGELPDVIVATDGSLHGLPEATVVHSTITPLVRTGIGIGVAAGAPVPDVSTVAALTTALVSARSVAYSRTGQSGIYFAKLLGRLGIAALVNERATIVEKGFTGEAVADGRADIAVQQISELRFVPGLVVAGPLPSPVQSHSDFSVALTPVGRRSAAARALHEHLRSPDAGGAYVASGLELPMAAARSQSTRLVSP